MIGSIRLRDAARRKAHAAASNFAAKSMATGEIATAADEVRPANVSNHCSTGSGMFANVPSVRVLAYGVLPAIAIALAGAAGWLKWQEHTDRVATPAGVEALQAARDGAVAMLSYHPDTADRDLAQVQARLTEGFRDTYTTLTRDVVIPAATQKQITATASVPAAAVVSATEEHAVVLLSVNQSATVGNDAPSGTTSSVRVTLAKVGDRWLISDFAPI